ncbi:hypothetical protein VNO80_07171 [Phaseolus coccineus]|uniref:Uncharacterized protein n=1 Tax=Phaseolus coccineus TaxID=3886 RepID=A0AAN9NJ89_PHACN
MKMATPTKSAIRTVFILLFIIIASDVCKNSEARNVVSLRCHIDDNCQFLCPYCGCKCVDTFCSCEGDPPSFTNNSTQTP